MLVPVSLRHQNRERLLKKNSRNFQERAACYARYSSQLQRSDSIDQQQLKCRETAELNGHTILPELQFVDEAVSGTKLDRIGLNDLIEAAKAGKFNILYIYSLSRLARESVITMPILKKLVHTYNIRCICIADGIDTKNTGWELVASIFSVINEQYIKDLSSNVLRGQEDALNQGYSVGDWCFGYSSEAVPGTEKKRSGRNIKPRMVYVINSDEAKWVSKIFFWFVIEERSIGWIVRELNRLNAPKDHRSTTKDWYHELVVNLLMREKYIGIWPWGEKKNCRDPETGIVRQEERPDEESKKWTRTYPQLRIIDDHTFQQAQERLQKNAEKYANVRDKKGQLKGSSSESNGRRQVGLFHNLLKCSHCGSSFYFTGKRFYCKNHQRGTCKNKTSVSIQLLQRMVLDEIGNYILKDSEWFEQIYSELLKQHQEFITQTPQAITNLKLQLQQVDKKIERLVDAVEEGNAPEDITKRLNARRQERDHLEQELEKLELTVKSEAPAPDRKWLREQLQELDEVMQSSTPAANSALSGLVGGKITLEEIPHPSRKRKILRGHFKLQAHKALGNLSDSASFEKLPIEDKEITIDFLEPDPGEQQRETAKKLYDEGLPMFKIAETLGVSRSRMSAIMDEAFLLLGQEKPDGRARRKTLEIKSKRPPLYQRVSEEVMELFGQGLLLQDIAEQLSLDRNTITSSVKHWHKKQGLPVPDGRNRRKTLPRKSE